MNKTFNLIGASTLSIISNTIIVIPFMLFIQLSDGVNLLTILPFVLFYIFRMTGIFFIRGIKTSLNSHSLLKLSLLCGIIGCLFSVAGNAYFPMYVPAGLFLGLSGAWLPPANTSMNLYLKQHNQKPKVNLWVSLALFLLLGCSMLSPEQYRYGLFFLIYGLMYVCALYTVKQLPDYKINSHDLEEASYRYLLLFAIFFILLFFLRSSRLLLNSVEFNYFVYGVFFLAILAMLGILFFKNRIRRKVPNSLMYLTIINGAVGNYLFLFSSLYANGYYGKESLPLKVYLPYVLGMVFAPKVKTFLMKNLRGFSMLGIVVGLLLVVLTPFFSIGIFITSLFKSTLNAWLTNQYGQAEYLPTDKRIWVKYTIQNIGSISHQFIMMILASIIVKNDGLPVKIFFVMTSREKPTADSISVMTSWNHIATTIVLLLIIIYGGVFLLPKKINTKKS